MFSVRNRLISIMICYSIVLHLSWAILILADESSVGATAISSLHRVVPNFAALSTLVGGSAILAIVGLCLQRWWLVFFLLPQQTLMLISAVGALDAMWLSQFADGVFRSRAFIMADQMYCPLSALGHTVALVVHTTRTLSR